MIVVKIPESPSLKLMAAASAARALAVKAL